MADFIDSLERIAEGARSSTPHSSTSWCLHDAVDDPLAVLSHANARCSR